MNDFEIKAEPARRLLRMTMRGYWDTAIFEAFAAEYRKAMQILMQYGGARYGLVDGRDFAVQSVEIAGKFGALIAECHDQMPPRTATLVAATLNKLQSSRAGLSGARYFVDPGEAEAWLFQDEQAPALKSAAG